MTGTGRDAKQTELLNALIEAHEQVDTLMAMIIVHDQKFMPSKSPLWPGILRRATLLRKYGVTP